METKSIWTGERVEKLKELWVEGLSCSAIARAIGGVTRNAVIGKVKRLHLTSRKTPHRQRLIVHVPKMCNLKAAPALLPREHPAPFLLPGGQRVTMSLLTLNMCRWPHGDPSSLDFHFCAHLQKPGSSYCEYHHALARSVEPASPQAVETAFAAEHSAGIKRAFG